MFWLSAIVFIGLLLALVLVHEWGHFIAARKAGCRVEEFGFGFPPRIASFTRGDTRYSFNLLPIGGFVKIEGEDMEEEALHSPTSFASKSAGWRIIILSAGVFMNVVLAVALLGAQSVIGTPVAVTAENAHSLTDIQTYVVGVSPHSPAEAAGLQEFDRIVAIDGVSQPTVADVQGVTEANLGQSIQLIVSRQGRHETVELTPRVDPPIEEGPIGISLQATGLARTPLWLAPWEGLKRTGLLLSAIVYQFGQLTERVFSDGSMGEALTGPIGIAVYTNEATNLGASYVLELGALISINLALINILPFPALDGGRIAFILVELVTKRRVPGKFEQWMHMTGFALLIMLMLFITFKDVVRYF